MKKIIALIIVCISFGVKAQVTEFEKYMQQSQKEYTTYKEKEKKDFEKYRAKMNAEFASYLKKTWERFSSKKEKKNFTKPKPKNPIFKKNNITRDIPRELQTIPNIIKDKISTKPIAIRDIKPIEIKDYSSIKRFKINFYGTPIKVNIANNYRVKFFGTSEKEISRTWKKITNKETDILVSSCMEIRKELSLCDWAYVELCGKIAKIISNNNKNKEVFIQAYLLTQSSFDMRLAKTRDNKLCLLLPSNNKIYNYTYINLDNRRYYMINGKSSSNGYYTYKKGMAYGKHLCDMSIEEPMLLKGEKLPTRDIISDKNIEIKVNSNSSLINFYKNYPTCHWEVYRHSKVTKDISKALDKYIKPKLESLSKEEKLSTLLKFIQKGFKYKTDGEQFGREKPFFVEETFFYPYCDCEDRAILFAHLVEKYCNLEVLLVHYPGHLCTAVKIDNISGDYLVYNNDKYLICDPTYLGAPIGKCMPNYVNSKARISK
ncbi:MAG: hypothetical protein N4A32_06995 [Marinifilaceae bacterium]|jgi:hypothetical protein|nr:hypothetical protein [Marinifilaceae bacterium]